MLPQKLENSLLSIKPTEPLAKRPQLQVREKEVKKLARETSRHLQAGSSKATLLLLKRTCEETEIVPRWILFSQAVN